MKFALKCLLGFTLATLGIAALLTLATAGGIAFGLALAYTAPAVFVVGTLCALPFAFGSRAAVTPGPVVVAPTPAPSIWWQPWTWSLFRPGPHARVHHHHHGIHPSRTRGPVHHGHSRGPSIFAPTHHGHTRGPSTFAPTHHGHSRGHNFFGPGRTGGVSHGGFNHGHSRGGHGPSVRMR